MFRLLARLLSIFIKNEFWKAQIIQLHMNDDKEIELIPRVGNHIILLGSEEEMEAKFEKLMLFYKKEFSKLDGINTALSI